MCHMQQVYRREPFDLRVRLVRVSVVARFYNADRGRVTSYHEQFRVNNVKCDTTREMYAKWSKWARLKNSH